MNISVEAGGSQITNMSANEHGLLAEAVFRMLEDCERFIKKMYGDEVAPTYFLDYRSRLRNLFQDLTDAETKPEGIRDATTLLEFADALIPNVLRIDRGI